jgi:hypothetical protein
MTWYVDRDDNRTAICWNCDSRYAVNKLDDVCDAHERLEPGEEIPAGQCPECGHLCYLEEGQQ